MMIMQKIKRNRVRCECCGQIIESLSVHHFVVCKCGKCAIDGGKEYLRRFGNYVQDFEEMSEYEEDE